MTADPSPVRCSVITGALGSGKTTAIRALMERPDMAGTALIVNEFGEVGLDHLLVSSSVETTLLMENGCMCCSLRGDVTDTILSLFTSVERGEMPPFHRILIETTGLADPVPIVRDLTTSPALAGRVTFLNVVTCVDGMIGRRQLAGDPVAVAQVAQADICLVTKTDIADPLALDYLIEDVARINPLAAIHRVREGDVPGTDVLFGNTSSSRETPAPHVCDHTCRDHSDDHVHHHHDHSHDSPHPGVESWSIDLAEALPWDRLRDWFDLVYSLHAARMLRMKGLIRVEDRTGPVLVQAVGPVVTPVRLLDRWPDGRAASRLVMISKDLKPALLQESFERHVLRAAAACT